MLADRDGSLVYRRGRRQQRQQQVGREGGREEGREEEREEGRGGCCLMNLQGPVCLYTYLHQVRPLSSRNATATLGSLLIGLS